MKRLGIAATILAIGLAGCGDDSNPNNPSDITVFTVQLSALNEIPLVTNSEVSARGTAVITFHKSSNTVDFSVSMNSFPAGSSARNAHIHRAPAGVAGGIVIDTGLTPATAVPVAADGSGTFSFTGVGATAALIDEILAGPQNFYFNVHSPLNGSGVIRGQLR